MLTPQQARQRLRRVSSHSIEFAESFDELLKDLLSEGLHFLCVDKISVWLVNDLDKPTQLNCIASTHNQDELCQSLAIHQYPVYFEQILLGHTVAANNVELDNRTIELKIHNNNCSRALLDTVIYHNGKPHGVVSCESYANHHIWTNEDIVYAESLADSCSRRLMALETLKLQNQLKEMAFVDTLTGLKNRRYFNERVQSAKNSQYRLQTPLSLIMIDLDHFKQVNDEFGHEAGDIVLAQFAKNCLTQLRLEDVLCRYGGEEFIIILPYTTEKQASLLAERLRVSVENMSIQHEQKIIKLTASFGVAEMGLEHTIEETIKRADVAVYKAKDAGRNCVITL
ncbi:diguanylate cyclase [Pseudoalteromonas sp. SSM20]|uniref:sensor domain-containing diguanylate cyclase n=1 Tax=Pseudoalteromonas sp. SSM20 TaxID=3139394 RepID=UPI003BA8771E